MIAGEKFMVNSVFWKHIRIKGKNFSEITKLNSKFSDIPIFKETGTADFKSIHQSTRGENHFL